MTIKGNQQSFYHQLTNKGVLTQGINSQQLP